MSCGCTQVFLIWWKIKLIWFLDIFCENLAGVCLFLRICTGKKKRGKKGGNEPLKFRVGVGKVIRGVSRLYDGLWFEANQITECTAWDTEIDWLMWLIKLASWNGPNGACMSALRVLLPAAAIQVDQTCIKWRHSVNFTVPSCIQLRSHCLPLESCCFLQLISYSWWQRERKATFCSHRFLAVVIFLNVFGVVCRIVLLTKLIAPLLLRLIL